MLFITRSNCTRRTSISILFPVEIWMQGSNIFTNVALMVDQPFKFNRFLFPYLLRFYKLCIHDVTEIFLKVALITKTPAFNLILHYISASYGVSSYGCKYTVILCDTSPLPVPDNEMYFNFEALDMYEVMLS